MNKKSKPLTVAAIAILYCSCGGGGGGEPASNNTESPSSVSTASISAIQNVETISVASSIAVSALGNTLIPADLTSMPQVKSLDKFYKDGAVEYVFTDEAVVSESGLILVNGTSSLSSSEPVSGHSINGDLDVNLEDFAGTVVAAEGTYKVKISGKLKVVVTGNLFPFDWNSTKDYSDITITGSGADLVATGDVSGTIVSFKITRREKMTPVDGKYQRVSTCSGTATVKTDTAVTTCSFQEDCMSCH